LACRWSLPVLSFTDLPPPNGRGTPCLLEGRKRPCFPPPEPIFPPFSRPGAHLLQALPPPPPSSRTTAAISFPVGLFRPEKEGRPTPPPPFFHRFKTPFFFRGVMGPLFSLSFPRKSKPSCRDNWGAPSPLGPRQVRSSPWVFLTEGTASFPLFFLQQKIAYPDWFLFLFEGEVLRTFQTGKKRKSLLFAPRRASFFKRRRGGIVVLLRQERERGSSSSFLGSDLVLLVEEMPSSDTLTYFS